MAYKRKRSSRYTRRVRRKTMRIPRPMRRSNNRHMFKRVVQMTPLTPSVISNQQRNIHFGFSGWLNQLPNVDEFVNLYDQYRINRIKVTMVPNWNSYDLNAVGDNGSGQAGPISVTNLGLPNIHSVIDYDNIEFPSTNTASAANLEGLMQYASYRRTRGTREHSRYWKPRILQQLYASQLEGGNAPAGTQAKQWIDLAYRDVPHYGLKVIIDPLPIVRDSSSIVPDIDKFLRVYVTYYFECRGVR